MDEELRRRDEILCPAIIVKIRYPIRGDSKYVSIQNCDTNTSVEVSIVTMGLFKTVLEHLAFFQANNQFLKIDIDSVHGGQNWIDLEEQINAIGWKNVSVINGPTEFAKKIKPKGRDGYHPGD